MTAPVNLNAMAFFEAAARLGRISGAAEELGVSPSAVSQQIRALEAQLGVLVFRREKRRLFLTQEGERLYQATTQALGMIRDARGAIMRQREAQRLIIRVSPSLAVRWLGPRLKDFMDQSPSWDLRIDAAAAFSDFDKETVDLDLRYGHGGWAGLHEERVLSDRVLPLCSPAYLATLRRVSDDPAAQLRAARLIDSVQSVCRWDQWFARQGIAGLGIAGGGCAMPAQFDRSSMAIQLAADGGGVALESATLALREIESGALTPLSPAFAVLAFPAYWLVCPPRHLNRRGVRAFRAWLLERAAAHDAQAARTLAALGCGAVQWISEPPFTSTSAPVT